MLGPITDLRSTTFEHVGLRRLTGCICGLSRVSPDRDSGLVSDTSSLPGSLVPGPDFRLATLPSFPGALAHSGPPQGSQGPVSPGEPPHKKGENPPLWSDHRESGALLGAPYTGLHLTVVSGHAGCHTLSLPQMRT